MAKIIDRQKKFEGDLNVVQAEVLQWLMSLELKEESDNKRLDWEMIALASNPSTNKALIDHLHSFEESITGVREEEIEWITPESSEEIEEMIRHFHGD